MNFTITDDAVKKAKEIRSKTNKPEDWVLSVGLQGGGCSGFKYNIDIIAPPEDESLYRIVEHPGLRVLCDKKSYIFLIGTEIGYEETIMSSGFTFNTPSATRTCGCGESVGF
jgi:iron-sulfur cluster assembly protein